MRAGPDAVAASRPPTLLGVPRRSLRPITVALVLATLVGGCGVTAEQTSAPALVRRPLDAPTTTTTLAPPPTAASPPAAPPAAAPAPTSPPGELSVPPVVAGDPVRLARQIVAAERVVRDSSAPADQVAANAHLQQLAYRKLGDTPAWDAEVLAQVPDDLRPAVERNVTARREFNAMHTRPPENVPAWRIVDPAPAAELLASYQAGEAEFGVPWEYLAAINLVETAMGRIRGLSSAGARGPMQFMPATWDAFGSGDIDDPGDAIRSAARYLAHNGGGRGDIAGALFNYNRSNRYVRGVTAYAQILEADPAAFAGFYHWQVYYRSAVGDLWLPTGYEQPEPIPAAEYAAR
ncbi:hypothetical protein BH20ACT2_BH20ACT2_16360 [soil metagenome]